MDAEDPMHIFFPDEEDVDLYAVLSLQSAASADEIKRAYRRLALAHHPDKHASSSEEARAAASLKFQQIGFAYAVLSDEKRRAKYDSTGSTAEGDFGLGPGEDGWEAYFEQMFEKVTRGKLDELKKAYQGSQEEIDDVKAAYTEHKGSLDEIMRHIPHSTHEDEPRLIAVVEKLISSGELRKSKEWERSSRDEKAKLVREREAKKEAKEAEALAKELGVWDEFYGSGKEGARRGKGKGRKPESKASTSKKDTADDEDDGDTAALQALILKRKKNMDGFFDSLAAKYGEAEKPSKRASAKGKKRSKATEEEEEEEMASPRKRSKVAPPPEIDDAEFEALQAKLFGDKAKGYEAPTLPAKTKKTTKGRKGK